MSHPAPQPAEPEAPLFPRQVQVVLVLLGVVVVVLLGYRGWQLCALANRPLELLPSYPVDLNHATLAELELLPGVGKTLAQRIDTHRQEHGGFHDVAELREIRGIGPILFETLKDQVCIGSYSQAAPVAPPVVSAPTGSKLPLGTKLDPNKASVEELTLVPGLGKTLAPRIVEARQVQPFRTVDDLRRVKGIGAKTLEAIRPYFQIAP
jgi:competence protein ComEA